MPSFHLPDLTFPSLPNGSHSIAPDFKVLLYRGGAGAPATKVAYMIAQGHLGAPSADRLPLIERLHASIESNLSKGKSYVHVRNIIHSVRAFYAWCDSESRELTLSTAEVAYKDWVEFLLHRVNIKKDLSQKTAYWTSGHVDSLISDALGLTLGLRRITRLKAPREQKRVLGTQADKQNLERTFEFGQMLLDISDALTISAVRGSLPVLIPLRSGANLTEWSRLSTKRREILIQSGERKPPTTSKIETDVSVNSRHPLINLRIEAELLIFISQTGMNLAQAHKLRRGKFRYKTDGNDLIVYRVYKHRRLGEAEFRIFKEYKIIFERYLEWVSEIIPEEEDSRLFPFHYTNMIPRIGKAPTFTALRPRCKQIGIALIGTRELRKTRVNWLLRRSKDLELTAEMSQHTKEVLMRDYERPHHQLAAQEITRFHHLTDPSIAPPGPGSCIRTHQEPRPMSDPPSAAPTPDCISPAGCLFCEFHRDIESQDYIWSLVSYRYLKALELSRYSPPSEKPPPHPAKAVIDRITAKLEYLKGSSSVRSLWVVESQARVREERYHPAWDGFIQCMELAP